MPGCGAITQKRWLYGHADGFLRHQSAAATDARWQRARGHLVHQAPDEADAVLVGLALHEHDLPEVERDGTVGGVDLVPAVPLARPCAGLS